jgi:4-amino-4-deoxy-L-arabinose transferase-like glycosyltransferase
LQRRGYFAAAAALLSLVAVCRIVLSYRERAQGFDEPCHISSALEFVDKGTYTLDPVHPPLARIAIGLPLYLAGEHYPEFTTGDPASLNYNDVGNRILSGSGHYARNLTLARLGILPFFLIAALLVFLWTRRLFGDFAALIAVAVFTTLPTVLAFSGLAYTDMPAACTQFAALFAFTFWLEKKTLRSALWLGITVGLALLSKLTTLIFLPAAIVAILECRWLFEARARQGQDNVAARWMSQGVIAVIVACLVVWGGYRFSVDHIRKGMQLSADSMPSFQHFPSPLRSVARAAVLHDPVLPAPALLQGVATAWVLNQSAPQSYLLGNVKSGGWWYFFLVGLAVKTPLPAIALFLLGWVSLVKFACRLQWKALIPAVAMVAVFAVTASVKYNVGVRHVLVLLPLLAVIAGAGAAYLIALQGKSRVLGHAALAGLLLWLGAASLLASGDYIAYFNEIAGHDPSKVLVMGCDLDCGQDLLRLAQEFRSRHIDHPIVAVWSSADPLQMGLPAFDTLQPFRPVTGWVAISMRSLRLGDVFHETYPPGAFAWLDQYEPVEQIGKTIRLYHIPELKSAALNPDRKTVRAQD